MKKLFGLLSIVILICLLSACSLYSKKPLYPLKYGAYGFEQATLLNKISKEETVKNFDDILDDDTAFKEWGNLLSFDVLINEDTEYFYDSDNRCFVISEGLAFEVVAENTLKLHFTYWRDYNYNIYDIVIILSSQILYG